MSAMVDKKKWTNATPVFSANKCRNPYCYLTSIFPPVMRKSIGGMRHETRSKPGLLGFAVIDMASSEHGYFDLANGKFTANTAGMYLFHFSGYYSTETYEPAMPDSASIELRVNHKPVARSGPRVRVSPKPKKSDENDDDEEEPSDTVTVTSFVRLKSNDLVYCYSDKLYLYEEDPHESIEWKETYSHSDMITTRFSAFYFPD